MLITGKGLGGGIYPISAVLLRSRAGGVLRRQSVRLRLDVRRRRDRLRRGLRRHGPDRRAGLPRAGRATRAAVRGGVRGDAVHAAPLRADDGSRLRRGGRRGAGSEEADRRRRVRRLRRARPFGDAVQAAADRHRGRGRRDRRQRSAPPWDELRRRLDDNALQTLDSLVDEALVRRTRGAAARARLRRDLPRPRLAGGEHRGSPASGCRPFPSRATFESYAPDDRRLRRRARGHGIDVVPTEMRGVDRADGSVVGYVVQPILAADDARARDPPRSATPEAGHPLVAAIVAAAAATVSPRDRSRRAALELDLGGRAAHLSRRLDADALGRGAASRASTSIRWPRPTRRSSARCSGGSSRRGSSTATATSATSTSTSTGTCSRNGSIRGCRRSSRRSPTASTNRSRRRTSTLLPLRRAALGVLLRLRRLDRAWRLRTGRTLPLPAAGPDRALNAGPHRA